MEKHAVPERLGRYEVIRELGKGAMGIVYEGRDPALGRTVAIKTARRDVVERSGMAKEMMERFLREARAAGMLNHPNIITIYDVGEEGDMAYIAMEFLEGKDLSTVIAERRLDIATVVDYGIQISEALACAHVQGIVHRDVKPANIFIPATGGIKMVDFGIAHTHDSTLTQDGALIGTPTYMSPEQFMGQKVDARSDLFSLGIILYEMLTGEKPFTGEALTTVMHHILKTNPAPPQELNYQTPEALGAVVMRAMAKKPQDRYPDGNAMAQALRESLKDTPDMGVILAPKAAETATVVAAAPPEGVQDKPTTMSESTVNDETSLSSATPAANTATVAEAPPTGISGVNAPPAQASETVVDTNQRHEPAQETAAVRPSAPGQHLMKHGRLLLGGFAALCLLAGFAIYLMAAISTPDTPETDDVLAATEQPDHESATPAAAEHGKVVSVGVWVYNTDDINVALDFINKQNEGADIEAWLGGLPPNAVNMAGKAGLSVRVSEPQSGEVYAEQRLLDGFGTVSVPTHVDSLRYELLYDDAPVHNEVVRIDETHGPEARHFVIRESDL